MTIKDKENIERGYLASGGEDDFTSIGEEDIAEEYGEETQGSMEMDEETTSPFVAELDLHSGEPSYALVAHPTIPGLFASAGGDDRGVMFCVLDDEDGLTAEVTFTLEGHTDTVEHVQFSPDGEYLATGSMDGTVRIWRVYSGELAQVLQASGAEINWIQWSPLLQEHTLAAGTGDGSVWIFDAVEGVCQHVLSGSATTSTCGSYTSDGKTLVTAGDGAIFIWDIQNGAARVTYAAKSAGNFPRGMAISLALHPAMPIVMVGFQEGALVVLHTQRHQILSIMAAGSEEAGVEWVSYMNKLPIMLSASLDGALRLWDSTNYKSRTVLTMPRSEGITTCSWLADGSVAAGGINGAITVWDVKGGAERCSFPPVRSVNQDVEADAGGEGELENGNCVYDIAQLQNSNIIAASFDDGKIRLYRMQ